MQSNGTKQSVRAALIGADEQFQAAVHKAVSGTHGMVDVGLETDASPEALLREAVTPMEEYDPQILFLDLGPAPDAGIRLAGVLSRQHPGLGIVVWGPALSQDQLLEAMRSGVSEVVGPGSGSGELSDCLERLLRKLGVAGENAAGRFDGRVMAFFSPKGGTGCTTVAMNFGIELHRLTGSKTLLVDLDLELGEMASYMGLKPRFHLVDLLANFHRMDENLLTSYIERHDSGVHVLSAPFEPQTGQAVTADEITAVIAFLRRQYDYVVVDTSKSLTPPAVVAMKAATQLFLVTNLDLCSLRNTKRCMGILRDIAGESGDRIRLIVNRYKNDALVSLADLESTLGLTSYCLLRNDFDTIITSLSTGQPLVIAGDSRYAQEIKGFAAKVVGRGDESRARGGALGRLLGALTRKEALSHA
jgi:pilus assembly protein CpaE